MRQFLTSQQTAFFTQNGYLEIAGVAFDPSEIAASAKAALANRPAGRDLWRCAPSLKKLITARLAGPISQLVKNPVRLAFDQWMTPCLPDRICPVKELFSIQGLVLCALFSPKPIALPARRASAVGIAPFPLDTANILFVKPHILLDWPLVKSNDLYLASYVIPNAAVYVRNPKDPSAHFLKELGYEFGDTLEESTHPALPFYT